MKKLLLLLSFLLVACQATPTATPETVATQIETQVSATETVPVTNTSTPLPVATEPANTFRISAKDGMTQIEIPAGTFTMGAMDVYRENDEQPPHDVTLDTYWIDQVEEIGRASCRERV